MTNERRPTGLWVGDRAGRLVLWFLVTATIRGGRPLRFSSALKGDGKGVVAYLAERVPNTEVIPFIG